LTNHNTTFFVQHTAWQPQAATENI